MARRAAPASTRANFLLRKKKTFQGEGDDERDDLGVEGRGGDGSGDSAKLVQKYEPQTFLTHPYEPHDKLMVEYFNGYQVTQEAKTLVEFGQNDFHAMSNKPNARYPSTKSLEWLRYDLSKLLNEKVTQDDVELVILFGTSAFDLMLGKKYNMLSKWESNRIYECMRMVFWPTIPATIPILSCFATGVIGSVPKEDPQRGILQTSLELECDRVPFLSGLVIPKVEGLEIKRFVVTKGLEIGEITLKQCKGILGITAADEKRLKGIAFFHGRDPKWDKEDYNQSPAVQVLHTYLKANPKVAMAGGILRTVTSNGTPDDNMIACGFLIFGEDKRVRVSCAALMEPEMSLENKDKMKKLKTTLMEPEKKNEVVSSFALMFASNERGIKMHGEPYVESQFFHQMFPKTKLVGGFDRGEFYREILVHDRKGVTLPPPTQINFSHVSVFLVVSYRHQNILHVAQAPRESRKEKMEKKIENKLRNLKRKLAY